MRISDFAGRMGQTLLGAYATFAPWEVTSQLEAIIGDAIAGLAPGYRVSGLQAVHQSATIEEGAKLKGPLIIGPQCLVACAAYLRGGVFMDEDCRVGPGGELKSTIMLLASSLAHLNFVGDSILGAGVNLEAGAVIANYRNERPDKRIQFNYCGARIDTGVDKFGAMVGDRVRIGANAVIAPGAALDIGTIVPRLSLVDMG